MYILINHQMYLNMYYMSLYTIVDFLNVKTPFVIYLKRYIRWQLWKIFIIWLRYTLKLLYRFIEWKYNEKKASLLGLTLLVFDLIRIYIVLILLRVRIKYELRKFRKKIHFNFFYTKLFLFFNFIFKIEWNPLLNTIYINIYILNTIYFIILCIDYIDFLSLSLFTVGDFNLLNYYSLKEDVYPEGIFFIKILLSVFMLFLLELDNSILECVEYNNY